MSNNTISYKNISTLLPNNSIRLVKFVKLEPIPYKCPFCGELLKIKRNYERTVEHLKYRAVYSVYYLFCNKCRKGETILPENTIPYAHVGLDVMYWEATLYMRYKMTWNDISMLLKDIFGLVRSPRSIGYDLERFDCFIAKSPELFRGVLQECVKAGMEIIGEYDETFFPSLTGKSNCIATVIDTKSEFVLNMQAARTASKDTIITILKEIQDNIAPINCLTADMAPAHKNAFTSINPNVNIQVCIFHFLKLIRRMTIAQINSKIGNINSQQAVDKLINQLQKIFLKYKSKFPTNVELLAYNFYKRIEWCLSHKKIYKIFRELTSFWKSWNNRIKGNILALNDLYVPKLLDIVSRFEKACTKWLSIIQRKLYLKELKTLDLAFQDIELMFKHVIYEEAIDHANWIINNYKKSSFESMKYIAKKITKYKENLFCYLQTGQARTTSVLEHFHNPIKKSTSYNRHPRTISTLKNFSKRYSFFHNTLPNRKRNEKISESQSPLHRLVKRICGKSSELLQKVSKPPYYYLEELSPEEYKEKLKEEKIKRKQAYEEIKRKSTKHGKVKSSNSWDKSLKRWDESNTQRNFFQCLINGTTNLLPKSLRIQPRKPKHEVDKKLLEVIAKNNGEYTRKELMGIISLPRTTIYDALNRLMVNLLIISKSEKHEGSVGRPKVKYFIIGKPPP